MKLSTCISVFRIIMAKIIMKSQENRRKLDKHLGNSRISNHCAFPSLITANRMYQMRVKLKMKMYYSSAKLKTGINIWLTCWPHICKHHMKLKSERERERKNYHYIRSAHDQQRLWKLLAHLSVSGEKWKKMRERIRYFSTETFLSIIFFLSLIF